MVIIDSASPRFVAPKDVGATLDAEDDEDDDDDEDGDNNNNNTTKGFVVSQKKHIFL